MRKVLLLLVVLGLAASRASAQDPITVDPKHYKLLTENDQVRVLKASYGPKEKSVMHSHPDLVAVFLTDGNFKFTLPGGKTLERAVKAGDATWIPAETHLPENLGDKPAEVILVEQKSKASTPK